MKPGTPKSVDALIDVVVRGELDEAQTLRVCTKCPELVTLAVLAAGKCIAELQAHSQDHQPSPSTPSGMVGIYTKPNTPMRRVALVRPWADPPVCTSCGNVRCCPGAHAGTPPR